jgi:hypothetical protein
MSLAPASAITNNLCSLYRRLQALERRARELNTDFAQLREEVGELIFQQDPGRIPNLPEEFFSDENDELWEPVQHERPSASAAAQHPAETPSQPGAALVYSVISTQAVEKERITQRKFYVILDSPRAHPGTRGIYNCTWDEFKREFNGKNCGFARARDTKQGAEALWLTRYSRAEPIPYR